MKKSINKLISFEKLLKRMWECGAIKCPLHLSGGNEKQLISIFSQVKKTDYVLSTHRNHYHYLLHGGDRTKLLNEILGYKNGLCSGYARSMCIADPKRNFYTSAIVGGICGIAVGIAWALKKKKSKQRVWAFVGDGCTDTGIFHESLRYAQGFDLPLTFVIEDNDRSTCTTLKERWGKNCVLDDFQVFDKCLYYKYKATYPHVGSGVYIQF